MSLLPYPDEIKAPDPHIWRNNAIFDGGDSVELTSSKDSWPPSNPTLLNTSLSLENHSDKENHNPIAGKSLSSVKSTIPIEPLHPNGACSNSTSTEKTLKGFIKQSTLCPSDLKSEYEDEGDENIDVEIEATEKEINRLSTKLKALRLRKAEKDSKTKMGSSEFGEKKQNVKNSPKNHGRGLSLDQLETEKLQRNISVQPMQKRRKSCFPRLIDEGKVVEGEGTTLGLIESNGNEVQEVRKVEEKAPIQVIDCQMRSPFFNEDKVTKQRGGRSLSLSPKSRLPVTMKKDPKRRLTTMGSKRTAKKGSGFLSSNKSKEFCNEGGKCVGHKKSVKDPKVIASRYTQFSTQKLVERKRSLPENNKEESKGCHEKCSPSHGYRQDLDLNQVTGTKRIKKRWEIPEEIIILESLMESPSPPISRVADLLPKVRTTRCAKDSPRDSGPAKRVVDLAGKKSYFGAESSDVKSSVCQVLRFNEGEE